MIQSLSLFLPMKQRHFRLKTCLDTDTDMYFSDIGVCVSVLCSVSASVSVLYRFLLLRSSMSCLALFVPSFHQYYYPYQFYCTLDFPDESLFTLIG